MYSIIVYDVKAHRTRTICNFLRHWLTWRQNSVFEGSLTKSEYERVVSGLRERISGDDQIVLYTLNNEDLMDTETIGRELDDDRFL